MNFSKNDNLNIDHIKYIARIFFDKYKNPSKNFIDKEYADLFIKDVYKSMGIIYNGFKNESEEMIHIFSSRKEGIYYEDVERSILRYLSPFQ